MTFGRSGLAALVAAAFLLAASPAFAATAVCTAKDSAGKRYTEKQTGMFDWQVKAIAEALAKADCQDKSKHPGDLQDGGLQGDASRGGRCRIILRLAEAGPRRNTAASSLRARRRPRSLALRHRGRI